MQNKASPSSSQDIRIQAADGSGSFGAYLALPRGGTGPGLVLAQEIFGVNKTMRDVADYYAEEGYVVLVPDLFWRQEPDVQLGYTPDDWQRAFALYQGFDEALGMQDMQAAITALRQRPEVPGGKVGALGFCLGGKLAYLAACRTDADVAVGYYGVGIDAALDEADRIRCKLALHVAELDGSARPRRATASCRPCAAGRTSRCTCTPASTTPSHVWAGSTSTAPRRSWRTSAAWPR